MTSKAWFGVALATAAVMAGLISAPTYDGLLISEAVLGLAALVVSVLALKTASPAARWTCVAAIGLALYAIADAGMRHFLNLRVSSLF